jgi:uncharacterized protein (TIGR03663 family)
LTLCGLIAVFAGLSRILFLNDKPYHHDESLHAYYSNRVAQGHPHEYSALLHGPVLYYFVGAFMKVFGAGETTARLPAALCGIAIVLLPLLWRKKIGSAAAAAISLFLLFSPTFMYFGRFLREDAFNSLWIACSLAGFFGFRWTGQAWMAVCSSVFLALQFCNKENSYLHLFIWLLGAAAIVLLTKLKSSALYDGKTDHSLPVMSTSEKIALWVNCALVFVVVFVLFYSSFFRHSKGALHGILDGLYRESLLYWWEQNQKRRIDGPFDYHSPLIFNYEFALIPALIAGWYRSVRLAALSAAGAALRFPLSVFSGPRLVFAVSASVVMFVLFLPRVGFTQDGCSIGEFCLRRAAPGALGDAVEKFSQLLHIAHSRHLLQILATVTLGAFAFMASVLLRRRLDAFLWWWATGAVGVYSYVGEKVPWLLVYVLLPLVVLAGLEVGRILESGRIWIDSLTVAKSSEVRNAVYDWETRWHRGGGRVFAYLTGVLMIFSAFKAIRVSFGSAANPNERLVFTQTTPMVKQVRERWVALSREHQQKPRVTMHGEATWPFAWYVHDLPRHDFVKPADAAAADAFDVVFLDSSESDFAQHQLTSFDVYKIPLRHWWVPQPNPRFLEILEYFLTSQPYPRELRTTPQDLGVGATSVLYLENRGQGRFFERSERFAGAELVAEAGRQASHNAQFAQEAETSMPGNMQPQSDVQAGKDSGRKD